MLSDLYANVINKIFTSESQLHVSMEFWLLCTFAWEHICEWARVHVYSMCTLHQQPLLGHFAMFPSESRLQPHTMTYASICPFVICQAVLQFLSAHATQAGPCAVDSADVQQIPHPHTHAWILHTGVLCIVWHMMRWFTVVSTLGFHARTFSESYLKSIFHVFKAVWEMAGWCWTSSCITFLFYLIVRRCGIKSHGKSCSDSFSSGDQRLVGESSFIFLLTPHSQQNGNHHSQRLSNQGSPAQD